MKVINEVREQEVREKLVWAGKEMCRRNLTSGTAGNISMRVSEDSFAITPSGMDYFSIKPEDIVILDFEDNVISGDRTPSVEKTMHRKIFQNRPVVNAVVHTHPTYGTAVASSQAITELPAIDLEMVSYLGGSIGIADFALSGSVELADNVQEAMGDKAGVLLQNHGALAIGRDMEEAFLSCEILEKACQVYMLTINAGGPLLLPEDFLPIGRKKFLAKFGSE